MSALSTSRFLHVKIAKELGRDHLFGDPWAETSNKDLAVFNGRIGHLTGNEEPGETRHLIKLVL